jgi:hypothetical protein
VGHYQVSIRYRSVHCRANLSDVVKQSHHEPHNRTSRSIRICTWPTTLCMFSIGRVKGYPSLGTSSHGSIFTVEIPREALNPASGYPGAKDPSRWVSTRMEPYLWDPATESAWPDRCFWTAYASSATPAVLRAKTL